MENIFDARWHRKALAGDAGAIEALAGAAITPLYRFCLYRVGSDRDLCEDVVQETMLRAIRELERYDPARANGDIHGWLTGLARNEIRRALTGQKAAASLEALWARMDRQLLSAYAGLDSQPFQEHLLRRAETREMVNAAMAQLPPQYGQALEAKYVAGHTVRQIARARRVSEKAVESLLSRARKAFRNAFLALARNLAVESPGGTSL